MDGGWWTSVYTPLESHQTHTHTPLPRPPPNTHNRWIHTHTIHTYPHAHTHLAQPTRLKPDRKSAYLVGPWLKKAIAKKYMRKGPVECVYTDVCEKEKAVVGLGCGGA